VSRRRQRSRKQRRATRAILKFGRNARPTHKLRSGRTGTAHSKKTPGQERRKGPLAVSSVAPADVETSRHYSIDAAARSPRKGRK
jgi:hypothetical protein